MLWYYDESNNIQDEDATGLLNADIPAWETSYVDGAFVAQNMFGHIYEDNYYVIAIDDEYEDGTFYFDTYRKHYAND